jgi:hypothetical protein
VNTPQDSKTCVGRDVANALPMIFALRSVLA